MHKYLYFINGIGDAFVQCNPSISHMTHGPGFNLLGCPYFSAIMHTNGSFKVFSIPPGLDLRVNSEFKNVTPLVQSQVQSFHVLCMCVDIYTCTPV